MPSARQLAAGTRLHHILEISAALVTFIAVFNATLLSVELLPGRFSLAQVLSGQQPLLLIGLIVDTVCCAFFWWQYFFGLRRAKDPRHFLIANTFWMLGAIPLLWPLRWLRVLRVLRYLLVFRLSPQAKEFWKLWVRNLLRHPVDLLLIATAVLLLSGSTLIYFTERNAGGTVQTWYDALWLTVTSATTDSYGDVAPSTPLGRILSISVAFLGIILVGSITAAITGFIIREPDPQEEFAARQLDSMQRQLARIEQQLGIDNKDDPPPQKPAAGIQDGCDI